MWIDGVLLFILVVELLLSLCRTAVPQQLNGRVVYTRDQLIALKPAGRHGHKIN